MKQMGSLEKCFFCAVASGRKKEEVVFEDSNFVAFKDANPSAPVHILIAPKKHIGISGNNLAQREQASARIFSVAREIAKKLRVEDSYNLLMNAGHAATKSPNHLHVHLIGGWKSPTQVRHL